MGPQIKRALSKRSAIALVLAVLAAAALVFWIVSCSQSSASSDGSATIAGDANEMDGDLPEIHTYELPEI